MKYKIKKTVECLRVSIIHVYEIPVRLDLKYWKSWWQSDHRLQESNQEVERSLHPSFPQFLSNNLLKCFVWQRNWLYRHSDLKGPWKKSNCSITYRITRHGRTIFLPLREAIEESAKRRHLWQYWAKRGAARCLECNADSSFGSRGCKQIGLQGWVWGRYRTLFTTNTNNYKTLW